MEDEGERWLKSKKASFELKGKGMKFTEEEIAEIEHLGLSELYYKTPEETRKLAKRAQLQFHTKDSEDKERAATRDKLIEELVNTVGKKSSQSVFRKFLSKEHMEILKRIESLTTFIDLDEMDIEVDDENSDMSEYFEGWELLSEEPVSSSEKNPTAHQFILIDEINTSDDHASKQIWVLKKGTTIAFRIKCKIKYKSTKWSLKRIANIFLSEKGIGCDCMLEEKSQFFKRKTVDNKIVMSKTNEHIKQGIAAVRLNKASNLTEFYEVACSLAQSIISNNGTMDMVVLCFNSQKRYRDLMCGMNAGAPNRTFEDELKQAYLPPSLGGWPVPGPVSLYCCLPDIYAWKKFFDKSEREDIYKLVLSKLKLAEGSDHGFKSATSLISLRPIGQSSTALKKKYGHHKERFDLLSEKESHEYVKQSIMERFGHHGKEGFELRMMRSVSGIMSNTTMNKDVFEIAASTRKCYRGSNFHSEIGQRRTFIERVMDPAFSEEGGRATREMIEERMCAIKLMSLSTMYKIVGLDDEEVEEHSIIRKNGHHHLAVRLSEMPRVTVNPTTAIVAVLMGRKDLLQFVPYSLLVPQCIDTDVIRLKNACTKFEVRIPTRLQAYFDKLREVFCVAEAMILNNDVQRSIESSSTRSIENSKAASSSKDSSSSKKFPEVLKEQLDSIKKKTESRVSEFEGRNAKDLSSSDESNEEILKLFSEELTVIGKVMMIVGVDMKEDNFKHILRRYDGMLKSRIESMIRAFTSREDMTTLTGNYLFSRCPDMSVNLRNVIEYSTISGSRVKMSSDPISIKISGKTSRQIMKVVIRLILMCSTNERMTARMTFNELLSVLSSEFPDIMTYVDERERSVKSDLMKLLFKMVFTGENLTTEILRTINSYREFFSYRSGAFVVYRKSQEHPNLTAENDGYGEGHRFMDELIIKDRKREKEVPSIHFRSEDPRIMSANEEEKRALLLSFLLSLKSEPDVIYSGAEEHHLSLIESMLQGVDVEVIYSQDTKGFRSDNIEYPDRDLNIEVNTTQVCLSYKRPENVEASLSTRTRDAAVMASGKIAEGSAEEIVKGMVEILSDSQRVLTEEKNREAEEQRNLDLLSKTAFMTGFSVKDPSSERFTMDFDTIMDLQTLMRLFVIPSLRNFISCSFPSEVENEASLTLSRSAYIGCSRGNISLSDLPKVWPLLLIDKDCPLIDLRDCFYGNNGVFVTNRDKFEHVDDIFFEDLVREEKVSSFEGNRKRTKLVMKSLDDNLVLTEIINSRMSDEKKTCLMSSKIGSLVFARIERCNNQSISDFVELTMGQCDMGDTPLKDMVSLVLTVRTLMIFCLLNFDPREIQEESSPEQNLMDTILDDILNTSLNKITLSSQTPVVEFLSYSTIDDEGKFVYDLDEIFQKVQVRLSDSLALNDEGF